jgi:DNA-binding NtrC family response regulator
VALNRILVVDDSPAVRETVGILLGNDYEVHAARVDDYLATGVPEPPPHLIIAPRALSSAAEPARFPNGVPILWIDDADAPAGHGASLPRRFSPRELRRRVADLLSGPRAESPTAPRQPDARLHAPFLPAAVTRGISSALGTDLPLHLIGEPGTGKRAVAKAVHAARNGGPFLGVPAAHFDAAVLATPGCGGGTLFIDNVEQLDDHAQQTLLAALEPNGLVRTAETAALRLVTATGADLEAAVDTGAFAAALFYRITVLTARLPPLRERSDEIPALAQMIGAELGALLGRPQIRFTERALERLSNYLWFGNIAELEAVLARTIALASETVIDADALLFDASQLHGAPAPATMPARNGAAALGGRPLDLIINELAHEFKNPLVTIKTFAHHLRRALPRGGDDEQAARLTGEAVQQIDQTLENLLEFTRLETPVPQTVPLAPVLTQVFAECGRMLASRGSVLEHGSVPRAMVRGDPQQLAYALTNLLRALTRDLAPKAPLKVRYEKPATLILTLPDGAVPLGSHLATLLDRPPDGSSAIPLGVAIAHAVFERNGAHVAFADDTPSTIIVRFTAADDQTVVAGNGTSPRIGR